MKLNRAGHLRLGRQGENAAVKLLQSKDYFIIDRNWRSRAGELDIVARDGGTLVFVEVKSLRRDSGRYRPVDNLSLRQMHRNLHAARQFLRIMRLDGIPARFDLIEFVAGNTIFSRSICHHCNYLPPLPGGFPAGGDDE